MYEKKKEKKKKRDTKTKLVKDRSHAIRFGTCPRSEKQQKGSLAGVEFQDTGATARIVSEIAFELSKVVLSLSLSAGNTFEWRGLFTGNDLSLFCYPEHPFSTLATPFTISPRVIRNNV